MTNYSVTTHKTKGGSVATVLGYLETYIETVADSKTIRLIDIVHTHGDYCIGVVIHDA